MKRTTDRPDVSLIEGDVYPQMLNDWRGYLEARRVYALGLLGREIHENGPETERARMLNEYVDLLLQLASFEDGRLAEDQHLAPEAEARARRLAQETGAGTGQRPVGVV